MLVGRVVAVAVALEVVAVGGSIGGGIGGGESDNGELFLPFCFSLAV